MEKWIMYAKKADFKALSDKYNIDQVTARVIVNRGVSEEDFYKYLNPTLENLYSPHLLKDLDDAVDMTINYIKNHKRIRIIGDYDCDGINSTFILASALKELNADVSYDIPDRVSDGYGLNERLVTKAYDDGIDLILTCDNGIAAYDAVKKAKDLGLAVIVTDHHEVPYEKISDDLIENSLEDLKNLTKDDESSSQGKTLKILKKEILPPADFVINPHREGDGYPFKEICGAVVAYKFVTALFEKLGKKEDALKYLENAAFATVCDIMPLVSENRAIVKNGLKRMESTQNIGLKALIKETGLFGKSLTVYDFGFVLGPCFNATGRLDTAKLAISLLFSEDKNEAETIAKEIRSMNEDRKLMTEQGRKKALEMLSSVDLSENPVIILYIPELHESLCGLVAGKIKEEYYHPTFVLTKGENGLKGSGRSIEAYSMYDKMCECKDLFSQFGGHPMAAGLSLPEENLPELIRRMNENAGLKEEDFEKKVMIDVPMPLSYLSEHEKIIDEIEALAPFGNQNERPLFADKNLSVKKIYSIGKEKKFWKIIFSLSNGRPITALFFGGADEFQNYYIEKFSKDDFNNAILGRQNALRMTIAYEPSWNEFRGNKAMQVVIRHYA